MSEKVLMKGNEALAEAAINAGCRHYFGYPITPQTEVAAYMAKRMPKIGGTFLQAESEIAAINMVIGAASSGVRAMTSSSSPGISLKSEGISYLAGCDVPALIVNVERGGPGLGGIQPSQSDYFQAVKGGGHGDYKLIVLAPASVQEMYSLTFKGFDLADKYRMQTMILADGTMGQMMEPVSLDVGEVKEYDKSSYATLGTGKHEGRNIINSLSLTPAQLEKWNFDRYDRYKIVEENEVMYEEFMTDDADYILVAFGALSDCRRLPSSQAARIEMALASPMPLYWQSSRMVIFPRVFRLLLQSAKSRFISSTALSFVEPEPMRIASSSAFVRFSAPSDAIFSRGRSSSAH